MILAIDTATDTASVALAEGDSIVGEIVWTARGNHSRHLSDVIRHLVGLAGIRLAAIDAIVVASGPGSFSGLRVGVSTAMGLAMGLHVPLAGVSTLDIIGFQASRSADRVWAVIPAGRDDVYIGRYEGQSDGWRRLGELARLPVADVVRDYPPGTLLAGPAAASVSTLLAAHYKPAPADPAPWSVRRASFLAELGRKYFDAGGDDRRDSMELIYLRRSSAEEQRDAAEGTD